MRECGSQLIASSSEIACLDEDSDVVVVGVEASSAENKDESWTLACPSHRSRCSCCTGLKREEDNHVDEREKREK